VRFVLVAAVAACCAAASIDDQQFNARWDITVSAPSTPRGWWLEISGAGTNNLKGKFVGVPAGYVEEIPKLSISDGELRFAVEVTLHRQRTGVKGLYWARLEDNKLKGTFEIEGDPSSYLEWTGVRAPALADKDDIAWRKSDPVALFDGRDLNGWQPVPAPPAGHPSGWVIREGAITSLTGTSDFVSDRKFFNFALEAEFRLAPRGNSGIGLRGRYELQLADDYEHPASNRISGAILNRIAPSVNAARPAGDWQTVAVRLVGRQLTVVLNGVRVIDRQNIDGLTAIAVDANEAEPGPIVLQAGAIEFRKIVVTPLIKRP
jgi:hypothetical protein